jgi:hypothetical protein
MKENQSNTKATSASEFLKRRAGNARPADLLPFLVAAKRNKTLVKDE